MEEWRLPEFFSSIGSNSQRLVSFVTKISDFETQQTSPANRAEKMEADIDIIASLIVVPRHIISSVPRRPKITDTSSSYLWPLIFGIQNEEDRAFLRREYESLLQSHSNAFSRSNLALVQKDVIRTDISTLRALWHSSRQSEDISVPQEIMCRILSLYAICTGTEYAQGMSDLLSPILAMVDFDESTAFWIFSSFLTGRSLSIKALVHKLHQENASMGSLHSFYAFIDSEAMKDALKQISQLVRLLIPELYSHLVSNGLESLLVCYRWLLVWFKREFSFDDTCKLWEVLCLTCN